MKRKQVTGMKREIKEVFYEWYDHLFVRRFPKILELVETAIKSHDYITFLGLQTMLNNMRIGDKTYTYLPYSVIVYYRDNPEEPVLEDLTEELFNLISDCAYECG